MKRNIKEFILFRTSDGALHENLQAAERHEKDLTLIQEIETYLESRHDIPSRDIAIVSNILSDHLGVFRHLFKSYDTEGEGLGL